MTDIDVRDYKICNTYFGKALLLAFLFKYTKVIEREVFIMKLKKLFSSLLLSALVFTALTPVHADDSMKITANLLVGDPGKMASSFTIELDDASKYADLTAADFDIINNYNGIPLTADGYNMSSYEDDGITISLQGNVLTINCTPFAYPANMVGSFEVVCSKYAELSFKAADVDATTIKTADDFIKGSYTASNGMTIPYRLRKGTGSNQPLVIWMHGAGEVGTDNEAPLTANRGGVAFAEYTDKAYVLLAQYPEKYSTPYEEGQEETMVKFLAAYNELIKKLISENKIDSSRVYLAGCSMGGGLVLEFMTRYTDLFAGVIAIASRGTILDDLSVLDTCKDLPIYLIHANGDMTNDVENSKTIYNYLESIGNKNAKIMIYSEQYMNNLGLYTYLLHWSWVPALNDEAVLDWLFAQKKSSNTNKATSSSTSAIKNTADQSLFARLVSFFANLFA